MWAYEARRIFSDRLVGDKARDKFEGILASVLQTDWSVDLANSPDADGRNSFYVTWGHSPSATDLCQSFGRQLGRLSPADMEETVAKAIIAYGIVTDILILLWYHVCVQVVNTLSWIYSCSTRYWTTWLVWTEYSRLLEAHYC